MLQTGNQGRSDSARGGGEPCLVWYVASRVVCVLSLQDSATSLTSRRVRDVERDIDSD